VSRPYASQAGPASGSDLLHRVRYQNNLPDIPFDAKFIRYPFDPHRFIQFKSTSLEKNFKWDIPTEQDLGVHIDLINQDYNRPNLERKR
jgi:RNA polymerase II-associated factor 1